MYNGKILLEWGSTQQKGNMHSVRKSLLNALIGISVNENKIDLNASLEQLGIDDFGELTQQEKQAKVIDLLEARSGVYHAAAYETKGMQQARPARGSALPGEKWYYNNWDFNVLGAIVERCDNRRIGESFHDQIATKIGMEDFTPQDVSYYFDPSSRYPAYLFKMTARDMARFGLLYMRMGTWQGRQIVPGRWVEESTTGHASAGPGVDYGYLWWVAKGHLLGNAMHAPAYRADGHGGQFIVVIPAYKLVIAHVSNFDQSHRDSRRDFGHFLKLLLAARTAP